MTLAVFPTLDGIEAGMTIRSDFKTSLFESLSGTESRIALRTYPKYTIKISLEFLIENQDEHQLTALLGFMNNRKGMHEAFLFTNPFDNAVVDETYGFGDGVRTAFSLQRKFGAITEPVKNINGTPTFYYDGTESLPTADAFGVVTYPSPPASGVRLSWTGGFYYQVRFAEDGYDFVKIMRNLYECKDIELIGSVRDLV